MPVKLREHIGPALFEAAFVVFGIVLAYAVNEWRETRVHRQDAIAARGAIVRELRVNRATTAASLAYHQGLLDSLRARREHSLGTDIGLFPRGFTAPAAVGNVAWEVAERTGALSHMPFDEVLRLSRAYEDQERYEQQAAMSGNVIYGELYRAGPSDMASRGGQLAALISSFAYKERALVALYDSTLAVYDRSSVSASTSVPPNPPRSRAP